MNMKTANHPYVLRLLLKYKIIQAKNKNMQRACGIHRTVRTVRYVQIYKNIQKNTKTTFQMLGGTMMLRESL